MSLNAIMITRVNYIDILQSGLCIVFCSEVPMYPCREGERGECGMRAGARPCQMTLERTDASCYLIRATPRLATGINHYWNKECPLTVIVISTRRP